MPVTPPEEHHEEGCTDVTFERKYYNRGGVFIKRSLRPREYRINQRDEPHVPRLNPERIKNEADALRFIREHTDIPVPTVYADFEDDEAYYLVVEYIKGTCMVDLSEQNKKVVCQELVGHVKTLQGLRSEHLGGPSGIVIPPYRVSQRTKKDDWNLRPSEKQEYVFCHNDLSQNNVIVDPETLKIKAIVDWEYAAFYPANFEMPIYLREGFSVALPGEVDDSLMLLEFLEDQDTTRQQCGSADNS